MREIIGQRITHLRILRVGGDDTAFAALTFPTHHVTLRSLPSRFRPIVRHSDVETRERWTVFTVTMACGPHLTYRLCSVSSIREFL